MSGIERFSFESFPHESYMSETPDGEYVLYKKFAELKAQRDALAESFDELAKAVGWSVERCEQTGESPMDAALSLVNLVSELENDATTAGQLEKLAGEMLNRTLYSARKQAVAYAECADMVAKFAASLRAGKGGE